MQEVRASARPGCRLDTVHAALRLRRITRSRTGGGRDDHEPREVASSGDDVGVRIDVARSDSVVLEQRGSGDIERELVPDLEAVLSPWVTVFTLPNVAVTSATVPPGETAVRGRTVRGAATVSALDAGCNVVARRPPLFGLSRQERGRRYPPELDRRRLGCSQDSPRPAESRLRRR